MAIFNLFALLGLLFIKIASASNAHSHPVEPGPAAEVITSVTVITSTALVKGTETIQSVASGLPTEWLTTDSGLTIQTSTPTTTPIIISTPVPSVDSGIMTIQTSTTPANANSTLEIQTSTNASRNESATVVTGTLTTTVTVDAPSEGSSTTVVTRTASTTPELVGEGYQVDRVSGLGAVVAFGVLLFGY